ncbi:MAG: FtsX-like permease family protein [Limnochordales bacterium]|nr:MAG: hypothetical protein DIU83_06795 [Bacillota bacterium]
MSVALKIAFRNILRHKTKTLIVGVLIAVGIMVLIVGNSLMDTAERGIAQTYVESYTGHLLITGRHHGNVTIMGLEGPDAMDAVMPVVPSFAQVFEYVANHPRVAAVNPQATAGALVDYEHRRGLTQAFGIDPEYYQDMFPDNIEILRGRMLLPGEEGIVLNEQVVRRLERTGEVRVQPGDRVILTGISTAGGVRVREVPVRGVFRFRHGNPAVNFVSLVDITNVRALAGMKLLQVTEAELTELEARLLGGVDEDELFGGLEDSLFSDLFADADVFGEGAWLFADVLDEDALLAGFGAPEDEPVEGIGAVSAAAQSDAWHFLLVKLVDGADPKAVAAELEQWLAAHGIDAMVSDWLSGAGAVASLATGTKLVFNIVVVVIAVVAVIIIMNTLVISVTERTTEIGTMRALGAQKSFVRRIIVWETVMTAGLFGLVGVAAGLLVLLILNWSGIEAPNAFFEVLFGGKVLRPVPSLRSIVSSLVIVLAIGVASSLYPVSIALRTEPVQAMQE